MMTDTRRDRVLVALDALLPQRYTWEERCDAEWLDAFPAGVAPMFLYGTTVYVCPNRIVEVGESLEPYDFESLLDALIEWVMLTMVDFQAGLSASEIIARFTEREPVEAMVLEATAVRLGVPLPVFLGVGRGT